MQHVEDSVKRSLTPPNPSQLSSVPIHRRHPQYKKSRTTPTFSVVNVQKSSLQNHF